MSANERSALDPARVARILAEVTGELTQRFPELSQDSVHATVTQAIIDFVSVANISPDLARLVRRRATARLLATHPQPRSTAYNSSWEPAVD